MFPLEIFEEICLKIRDAETLCDLTCSCRTLYGLRRVKSVKATYLSLLFPTTASIDAEISRRWSFRENLVLQSIKFVNYLKTELITTGFIAIKYGRLAVVKRLLEMGVNNRYYLSYAVWYNQRNLIETLVPSVEFQDVSIPKVKHRIDRSLFDLDNVIHAMRNAIVCNNVYFVKKLWATCSKKVLETPHLMVTLLEDAKRFSGNEINVFLVNQNGSVIDGFQRWYRILTWLKSITSFLLLWMFLYRTFTFGLPPFTCILSESISILNLWISEIIFVVVKWKYGFIVYI